MFAIWCAHRPAYAATVIGAEPLDLARKIDKAMRLKGPRLILALAPCPTGWGYEARETVAVARQAVASGIFPLLEYEGGRVTHTRIPRPRTPVEDYLRLQGRFAHLFEPVRDEVALAAIQAAVDAHWAGVE